MSRESRLSLGGGLCLRMVSQRANAPGYPTSVIQKGLILCDGASDLAEEGVGFGVPLLKQKLGTVFPASARIVSSNAKGLTADFDMSLAEGFSTEKKAVDSPLLDLVKEVLAGAHRGIPLLRCPLSALSSAIRTVFSLKTVFHRTVSLGFVRVEYRIDKTLGKLTVRVDARGAARDRCTELIVMNELGARHFCRYRDSDGLSLGEAKIETWHEVRASEASFLDPARKLGFSVRRHPAGRLFRGREVVAGRLSWAGFGYVLPADTATFRYSVRIRRESKSGTNGAPIPTVTDPSPI
jgi:hypothetical protein